MDKVKMTKAELEELIQYFYSEYCNCISRSDERKLYFEAYLAMKEICALWMKENRFAEK